MASLEGWDLVRFRAYLRTRAELLKLNPRLLVRFDESDLVQETLLKAADPDTPACRGLTTGERLRWLDEIMTNTFLDLNRRHHAGKRDVGSEENLRQIVDETTGDWDSSLVDPGAPPGERAILNEERLRLGAAIQELPAEQREVVMSRDILGQSMTEIAARLGKSKPGVSRLYRLGVVELGKRLAEKED